MMTTYNERDLRAARACAWFLVGLAALLAIQALLPTASTSPDPVTARWARWADWAIVIGLCSLGAGLGLKVAHLRRRRGQENGPVAEGLERTFE